jgi:hypothetical protein
MSQLRFLTFLILIYLLILQPSTIECRPHIQKIIIHGHEWTVPNEPGWENGNCFFSNMLSAKRNNLIL